MLRIRLLSLVALFSAPLIPANVSAQDAAPFAPIAGDWDRHGFGITVHGDGSSEAVWRIYQWCGPGVAEPCDRILNNNYLESGGHAQITFSGPDDSGVFQGEVTTTTDPSTLDLGGVTLTLQPYDMALIEQGDTQLVLCGQDSAEQAPSDVLRQCGA
jgi:hypothetical protein